MLFTGTITMASHHNVPTVSLTGTCVPKDSAGSQRKHETQWQGEGSVSLYVCIFVCSWEAESAQQRV